MPQDRSGASGVFRAVPDGGRGVATKADGPIVEGKGAMGTREFRVGDRVIKNPANWSPSEFDSWGAGEGRFQAAVGRLIPPERFRVRRSDPFVRIDSFIRFSDRR